MKLFNVIFCTLSLFLLAASVFAQEVSSEEEEATIEVVGEANARPGEITDAISLPQDATVQAQESAAFGLETAKRARQKGEESGEERAEAAREKGRMNGSFGAETRVEAQASGGMPEGSAQGDLFGSKGLNINR